MKSLYKALADFQQEVPTIKKNSTGYGYKFADLEEINNIIKPLLKKNGLGYAQPIEGSAIKTIIFHVESGETLESLTDIPQGVQLAKMNDLQVLGSAITYLRRYSLSSMLGLVTDEDADASGEQVVKPIQEKDQVSDDQKAEITKLAKQLDYTDNEIKAKLSSIRTGQLAQRTIEKLQSDINTKEFESDMN